MKTRNDIYGKEAAEILRCITLYHSIRLEQLKKLFPNTKPEVIEKLVFHLQNNRRILHNKDTDIIYDNDKCITYFEYVYCLWVVCDFIEKIDFHSSSDFPVHIVFFGGNELYEVTYIPQLKEAVYERAFDTFKQSGKRIIVLESKDQISKLKLPNVTAYCTVDDETGIVKYFKLE